MGQLGRAVWRGAKLALFFGTGRWKVSGHRVACSVAFHTPLEERAGGRPEWAMTTGFSFARPKSWRYGFQMSRIKNRHGMVSPHAPLLVALVDASTEDLPNCLGTLISRHVTRTAAEIARLDHESAEFHPTTRIIKLTHAPQKVVALIRGSKSLRSTAKAETKKPRSCLRRGFGKFLVSFTLVLKYSPSPRYWCKEQEALRRSALSY
jgi:hypothetical protein